MIPLNMETKRHFPFRHLITKIAISWFRLDIGYLILGKFHGLDQLGIGDGGHRGGAVDRVAGGHSSYATGLGIGKMEATKMLVPVAN